MDGIRHFNGQIPQYLAVIDVNAELKQAAAILVGIYVFTVALFSLAGPKVHEYKVRDPTAVELRDLRTRLASPLDKLGLVSEAGSDRMTGPIGCGRDSPDRTTWLSDPVVITLHEFTCGQTWHVVVVTASNDVGRNTGARIKESIDLEFRNELATGRMTHQSRRRAALE